MFLADRAESLQQPDVDLLAAAEVVVDEAAGDAGRLRDVLDRDLVVAALGEQDVGRVEDLIAALPRVEAAELGVFIAASLQPIGNPSTICYHVANKATADTSPPSETAKGGPNQAAGRPSRRPRHHSKVAGSPRPFRRDTLEQRANSSHGDDASAWPVVLVDQAVEIPEVGRVRQPHVGSPPRVLRRLQGDLPRMSFPLRSANVVAAGSAIGTARLHASAKGSEARRALASDLRNLITVARSLVSVGDPPGREHLLVRRYGDRRRRRA